MQTKEIPQTEWTKFINDFSRRNEGQLINLEIFSAEIGDQIESQKLPLVGMTTDWEKDETFRVSIMIGSRPDDHITHNIVEPIQISLEQTEEGLGNTMAIKTADGTTTLLRFSATAEGANVDAATT